MAITTVDQAIAGMQPMRIFYKSLSGTFTAAKPFSTWNQSGIPGAGAQDTTLNGAVLDSTGGLVSGQIPFYNPVSGFTYLAKFIGQISNTGGTIFLCDRLWSNGGYTITSSGLQSSTTPTWPARDNNGATDGEGVMLGLEISAGAGAATPTITVTYTNSGGTGSRTAGFAVPAHNSPITGAFFPIALQAGDTGVKSLESIQLSTSWLSGTMNMVAWRVIASLGVNSNLPFQTDLLTGGMQRLYNGSVPFIIFVPQSTTTAQACGSVTYTQG